MLIGHARVSTTDQDLTLQLDALAKAGWVSALIKRPSVAPSTRFFEAAFDAEVIYDSKTLSDEPDQGAETEQMLGLFPGTKVSAVRMVKLRNGPGLELFQMEGPEQREPMRPSDYGLQHFAVYVDDIKAAVAQFEAAGGTMFSEPQAFMFGPEEGDSNYFCYGRTPWGSVIEMLTIPSPMPYEKGTPLRRWRP